MRFRNWLVLAGTLALLTPLVVITGAIQLENRDSFCGSCHTEPESAFVSRSGLAPVDLASAHAAADEPVRCIDCHSGEGLGGRAGSLYQGAQDLAAFLSGDYRQPAATTQPVGDTGCLKCHSTVGPAGGDSGVPEIGTNSHFHRQAYTAEWRVRRRNPAGTCAVCHAAHWDGGQASTGFRNNLLINAACDDCHNSLAGWTPPDS